MNRDLRIDDAKLLASEKLTYARMAAMVRRMDGLVSKANRKISAVERREKHRAQDPNEIAGSKLHEQLDNVVFMEITKKKDDDENG